jgi:S1-C subfamily serine protease
MVDETGIVLTRRRLCGAALAAVGLRVSEAGAAPSGAPRVAGVVRRVGPSILRARTEEVAAPFSHASGAPSALVASPVVSARPATPAHPLVGFVLGAEGELVVGGAPRDARRLHVRLGDGVDAAAEIAGRDARTGLVVARTAARPTPVAAAESDVVGLDDWLVVVDLGDDGALRPVLGQVTATSRGRPDKRGLLTLRVGLASSAGAAVFTARGALLGVSLGAPAGGRGSEVVLLATLLPFLSSTILGRSAP